MARLLRGEVYWADLNPVRGREEASLRPVLVISHQELNRHSGTVIALAITSQPQRAGFPRAMTELIANSGGYFMSAQEEREAKGLLLLEIVETEQAIALRKREAEKIGALLNTMGNALKQTPRGFLTYADNSDYRKAMDFDRVLTLAKETKSLEEQLQDLQKRKKEAGL